MEYGTVVPIANCILSCLFFFPDMPCMKRFYRHKQASTNWSAAKNKLAR